jgi:alpha-L-fucosidase
VGGAYENYVTPEMCVPEKPLRVPWESCLTLGADFNYAYGDHYKSPRELVNLLVNIVAKGGNMALNVSPQPDGRIPVEAWESLRGLGAWMQTYGEAIYGTRICAPYQSGNLAFTQKGDTVYAIRLYPEEGEAVEEKLLIPYQGKIRGISMVDTKKEAEWKMTEEGIQVVIPQEYREGETPIAIVWKIEQ